MENMRKDGYKEIGKDLVDLCFIPGGFTRFIDKCCEKNGILENSSRFERYSAYVAATCFDALKLTAKALFI